MTSDLKKNYISEIYIKNASRIHSRQNKKGTFLIFGQPYHTTKGSNHLPQWGSPTIPRMVIHHLEPAPSKMIKLDKAFEPTPTKQELKFVFNANPKCF